VKPKEEKKVAVDSKKSDDSTLVDDSTIDNSTQGDELEIEIKADDEDLVEDQEEEEESKEEESPAQVFVIYFIWNGFCSVIINFMLSSENLAVGLSVESRINVKNVFHRNSTLNYYT
jgi:hypothetical protein